MYRQLQRPDLTIQENAGYSLAHIQKAYNAPVKYFTAWEAWMNTDYRHSALQPFPDAYVPVWFYTTTKGIEQPLGHVMIWDPLCQKLWGTPHSGYGKQWFTRDQIENNLTRYVGWSEDINGVRVVEPRYAQQEQR